MTRDTHDGVATVAIIAAATGSGWVLKWIGNVAEVNLVYIVAVLFIAMQTEGYRWGILASVAGVFATNYFFAYPYLKFNFVLAGYPLTFITMLAVSVITSMLATRAKQQANITRAVEMEKKEPTYLGRCRTT